MRNRTTKTNKIIKYTFILFIILAIYYSFYQTDIGHFINNPEKTIFVSGDLTTPLDGTNIIDEYFGNWNNHYSFRNSLESFRSIFYIWITPFYYSNFPALHFFISTVLLHIISFFSLYIYLNSFKHQKSIKNEIMKIALCLIYSFNPYVFIRNHHPTIRIVYSIIPIFIYLFIKISNFKTAKITYYHVLLAFFSLFLFMVPHYMFYSFFIIILVFIYSIIRNKKIKILFYNYFITFCLFIIMGLPFFLILFESLKNNFIGPEYVITLKNILLLSKNTGIFQTILFYNYWTLNPLKINFLAILAITSSSLLMSLAFLKKGGWHIKILFLIIIGFSQYISFQFIFNFLIKHSPSIASLLRDVSKLMNFVIFLFLILIWWAFRNYKSFVKYSIICLTILFFISINIYFMQHDSEEKLFSPEEKIDFINNFNAIKTDNAKIIVIPEYWSKAPKWSNGNAGGRFTSFSLSKNTHLTSKPMFKEHYLNFISPYYNTPAICNASLSEKVLNFYDNMGIKYFFIQKDINLIKIEDINCIIYAFSKSPKYKLLINDTNNYIYYKEKFTFIKLKSKLLHINSINEYLNANTDNYSYTTTNVTSIAQNSTKKSNLKLINYSTSNDRHYIFVNSLKDFYVDFPESYDKLWVAKVNGIKYTSINTFQNINTFHITQTGKMKIEIYKESFINVNRFFLPIYVYIILISSLILIKNGKYLSKKKENINKKIFFKKRRQ
jgi:hypothetical protein